MTAIPTWFGPEDRPLFGWFHLPADGRARAGVVVCPPLAREYLDAHYAQRVLAERLVDLGICVLRFDYHGTGDSAGTGGEPERVAAWLDSVSQAVAWIRQTGMTSVTTVGLRFGALLAGLAAEVDGGFDGLVLWDPVTSGRRYLVEQRALTTFAARTPVLPTEGGIEAPGLLFDPLTAAQVGQLDLTMTEGPLAQRILVLSRQDRPSGALKKRLEGTHVEWSEATGQAELMDVGSPDQLVPYELIDHMSDWIAGISPDATIEVRVPESPARATVGISPGGAAIIEKAVRIGPAALFGIETETAADSGRPAVVLIGVANEHRVGPARTWVELARRLAGEGFRSVRVDLSGLGDSPVRHADQPPWVKGLPVAFDDVLDIVRHANPDDPSNVILVGLCSSAYQALESALEIYPRGVVAIQPVLSFVAPETADGDPVSPRRKIALTRNSLVEAFADGGVLAWARRRFPNLGWRVRMVLDHRRGPGWWLKELTRRGVDVLIICGEWEGRAFRTGLSGRTRRHLSRSGRFRFDYRAELEHGLLRVQQRAEVIDVIFDHVRSRFAPTTTASAAVAPDSKPAPQETGLTALVQVGGGTSRLEREL
jgi:alpha-beta hydrolase superfamily lysophospholipase